MIIIKGYLDFINEGKSNIYQHKHGYPSIEIPLIPDAIEVISKNKNAIRYTDKKEFEEFANAQRYFSAGYTHCFYTLDEYNQWHKNGSKYTDKDSENSKVLKQFGEIIQVWDEKNHVGYVVPSDKTTK
jgi:hypothetical protein